MNITYFSFFPFQLVTFMYILFTLSKEIFIKHRRNIFIHFCVLNCFFFSPQILFSKLNSNIYNYILCRNTVFKIVCKNKTVLFIIFISFWDKLWACSVLRSEPSFLAWLVCGWLAWCFNSVFCIVVYCEHIIYYFIIF